MRGYYFITDSALSRRGNARDVRDAVAAGACAVQYRDKGADSRALYEAARALRELCGKTPFIVNDRLDIALAAHADGVHLGQGDVPCRVARKILGAKKIIGVTVHTVAQAVAAAREGADYVAVSPIFATGTKKDAGRPVGLGLLRRVKARIGIPVVAIGGITHANVWQVIAAGADCVCAISDVIARRDVKKQIRIYQRLCGRQTVKR
jgi:thiamine-phosphate pyrophosphorylase